MRISVIIPVYNADQFLDAAVSSALAQPETAEILLVEDGSSDSSLSLCRDLARRFSRVRLFQHGNSQHRGAAASRNVGVREAVCEYVSFLDADDFFLPGRFSVAAGVFSDDSETDGVYEAVGIQFESDTAERRWREDSHWLGPGLLTMSGPVEPEELFEVLLRGRSGKFCTDGIVVKKSLFGRTGLFEESLAHHEDTHMWLKMAAVGRLKPGRIMAPVAIRRIHDRNMTWKLPNDYNPHWESFITSLCDWGARNALSQRRIGMLRYSQ